MIKGVSIPAFYATYKDMIVPSNPSWAEELSDARRLPELK